MRLQRRSIREGLHYKSIARSGTHPIYFIAPQVVPAKSSEVGLEEKALSAVPETLTIAPATITVYRFAAASLAGVVRQVEDRKLSTTMLARGR